MGFEYNKRKVGKPGSIVLPVNSVTLSTALQTLAIGMNAVTYDTSGVASDAAFPVPQPGDVLRVSLNNGTTSLEANFNTAATDSAFFGTTASNTITIASTAGSLTPYFELTGVSTSQWALIQSSSVDWTVSSTTGSTGQA
jgi:hypothetical protein